MRPWYELTNAEAVESPALLLSPAAVRANVRHMIEIADTAHLWPHVKTHKLAPLIALQCSMGLLKFKAATLAEVEMCAQAGARRVLWAMAAVGPNVAALCTLAQRYPDTGFGCLADDAEAITHLSEVARQHGVTLDIFIDLDIGMHRTGIEPGAEAEKLWKQVINSKNLRAFGLHAYDGHIDGHSREERAAIAQSALAPALDMRTRLQLSGMPVPFFIVGGTPTFPIHAADKSLVVSPGSTVLWTWCLAQSCPDLAPDFQFAAVLLARVVSRPSTNRLTLDLGHKALAADQPLPVRAIFPQLPDARPVTHSEEHLVLETSHAADFPPGSVIYAHPAHICPTVALHGHVVVVEDHRAIGRWEVTARDRLTTLPEAPADISV